MTTPLTKESITSKRKITKTIFACLLIAVLGPSSLIYAQPAITAENMSLGGGGTAYLNGSETTFWNPANLMIRDQPGQFHLTVGQNAFQFEPLLSSKSVNRQFVSFLDGYQPYTQVDADINAQQKNTILNTHYPENKLQSQHQQRADFMLAGAVWQQEDYALSIALRARYASNIRVGRGWYDDRFIEQNDRQLRDFSLIQHRSEFYELAVGYAQEFTFINGLTPRLNKLYIGIAPKIILAGPTFSASYDARYLQDGEGSITNAFISDFSMQSSGSYSGTTTDYLQSSTPREAIKKNIGHNYQFEQTGYGVGFDFGLNYLIPLSSKEKTSSDRPASSEIQQSLRVAFSLNDIGAIRYHKQPLTISSPADSSQAHLPTSANTMFVGAGGQYINHLHEATFLPNPLLNAEQESDDKYSTILPTSINTGILLDLERVKFMGDLTLGLNNTAFTTTNLDVRLGAEVRPIRQIPIRIGTRFATEQPFQMGLGTGIETKQWDFTIGARTLFHQESPRATFVGGAFGGFQFHF